MMVQEAQRYHGRVDRFSEEHFQGFKARSVPLFKYENGSGVLTMNMPLLHHLCKERAYFPNIIFAFHLMRFSMLFCQEHVKIPQYKN